MHHMESLCDAVNRILAEVFVIDEWQVRHIPVHQLEKDVDSVAVHEYILQLHHVVAVEHAVEGAFLHDLLLSLLSSRVVHPLERELLLVSFPLAFQDFCEASFSKFQLRINLVNLRRILLSRLDYPVEQLIDLFLSSQPCLEHLGHAQHRSQALVGVL